MTDGSTAGRARTPKHLWVVGIVALLWNSMGALDYTMTQTRNAAYLKALTPTQLAYFDSLPAWAVAAWAIGVWGGLVGSVLLLLRKRLAVPVFLASLLGAVAGHTHTYILSDGLKVMGGGAGTLVFSGVIILIALGLLLYARAMARREVLN
jgi:hypothetical protein